MERHHYRAKNDPNSYFKVWNQKDNFNQQHAKLGVECEKDSGGATTAIQSYGNDVEGVYLIHQAWVCQIEMKSMFLLICKR